MHLDEPTAAPRGGARDAADGAPAPRPGPTRRTPGQTLPCGWCGRPIAVRPTGRLPKWCSDACRHRAWEQTRAAASGRCAVQILDRVVHHQAPPAAPSRPAAPTLPKGPAWAAAVHELSRQLDTGRIYDRDLPDLATAVADLATALQRRTARPPRRRWG